MGILIGASAVLGLAIGSFLNVVIYRVPRKMSVVFPRSFCPNCSSVISSRDNIPVVSWLLLKGKCRVCKAEISPRYLVVELLCALLFAAAAARLGPSWALPAFLAAIAGLIALSAIDLEVLLLPKRIVYLTLAIELVFFLLDSLVTNQWHNLITGVISALIWFAIFYLINLLVPTALGFGDVRLALPLGLGLGWLGYGYAFLGFFAANLTGAVIGIVLILSGKMKRAQRIPYGVFLSIGFVVALFTGKILLSQVQIHL